MKNEIAKKKKKKKILPTKVQTTQHGRGGEKQLFFFFFKRKFSFAFLSSVLRIWRRESCDGFIFPRIFFVGVTGWGAIFIDVKVSFLCLVFG